MRRWVPKAFADKPTYVFETGGSTGIPKSRISIDDFRIDYEAFSDTLILLGGLWRALGWLLRLIPRPLREFGYSIIARYRYSIFGRYETCPLPTVAQRNQFIGIPD